MMQDDSPLGRAIAVVADLRVRCGWDRVQTRETLRPYLVEEVLELDAALRDGDRAAIRDEVGDLMLHLAWQLVLGAEAGEFTAAEIADDVVDKMRRRHPHLFDLGPARNWQTMKAAERSGRLGALDGLPRALPALLTAFRLQERAAGVGFDWPDATGPIAKVREELQEVEAEIADASNGVRDALVAEIGDLLFAVVNVARKLEVHPERALERANAKFRHRFAAIERLARERNIDVADAGLDVLDGLWREVKRGPE